MARIKTTPMVRFALIGLRVYLILLLLLIGFKFAQILHDLGGSVHKTPAPVTMPPTKPFQP